MPEQVLLDEGGVQVTNARFIARGRTYAMSGITSVSLYRKPAQRGGPIVCFLLALVCLLALSHGWGFAVAASVFLIIGACWWRTEPIWFSVRLMTSSGESDAFTSRDESQIQRVVRALNDAIVARG